MLFVEAITYFSVMQFGADASKTRQSPSANDMGEITGRTRSCEPGPRGGICGRGLAALAVPGGHCRHLQLGLGVKVRMGEAVLQP